jgi:hypothetical protein
VEQETDKFEETYAELRKWADVNSPKYLLLTVKREKRAGRLGSALKVRSGIFSPESITLNIYTILPTCCRLFLVVTSSWQCRLWVSLFYSLLDVNLTSL